MSFPDSQGRGGAAGETKANAVLEQQGRLAAEFSSGNAPVASTGCGRATGPFARMLCELLTSIGWEGPQHRIYEALPHLSSIGSIRMLRAVLARLDVDLIPTDRRPNSIAIEDLPCLLVEEDDNCHLVTPGAGEQLESYGLNGVRAKAGRGQLRGEVFLIRRKKTDDLSAKKPFGGFVGHVLKQLRGSLSHIAAYSAAINAVGLILSLYVVLVYDVVIATSSIDTLAFLALGALGALGLEFWLRRKRSSTLAYLAARFDAVVSVRTLGSVLNLPLAMTERAPVASQLSRFRQFEIGRDLFAGQFASALFDLPFTLLFFGLLFVIGGVLGFVPVGLAVVIVVVSVVSSTFSIAQIARVSANKLRSDGLLFELTDKLRTIRHASAERIWLTRYADSLATYQRSRVENMQLSSHVQTVTNGLVAVAGIATLAIGALRVMNGTMSTGELVAAMMIVWRILVPIQIAALNIARIKQTLSTARQINDLVRMGSERESDVPPTLSRRLGGHIFSSSLYLSLGAQQEPQLRGVNLEVKAGEIVAITGPSGSGKSTLLKVLLGLYPQYMGTVRLGGLDLRQLHPSEARAAIGYASQQLTFFYGSVAANFRFANPGATDADIAAALAAVGVSLPCPELPDGLETRISGTDTRALSQGWLCRLSIARALVKKPAILLLDDPGNGLDQASDTAFMAHLNAIRGKRTVLWVTARPSHMRMADRVIEMRGGAIIADGKPDVIVPRILARMTAAA
jgi:ATP-binding cassette, subfamily C, bacterial LapB